jgi:competence protein ComK
MYMTGQYDRNGKQCTLVTETRRTFIVDQSPLEIIHYSTLYAGSSLKGAMEASRWLLGGIHMCPITVNPIQKIVVFPTRSAKHEDTIWFNPSHIKRATSHDGKALVHFKNRTTLLIPMRPSSFNNKLLTAEQLKAMTTGNAKGTYTLVLDPKKRKDRSYSK